MGEGISGRLYGLSGSLSLKGIHRKGLIITCSTLASAGILCRSMSRYRYGTLHGAPRRPQPNGIHGCLSKRTASPNPTFRDPRKNNRVYARLLDQRTEAHTHTHTLSHCLSTASSCYTIFQFHSLRSSGSSSTCPSTLRLRNPPSSPNMARRAFQQRHDQEEKRNYATQPGSPADEYGCPSARSTNNAQSPIRPSKMI